MSELFMFFSLDKVFSQFDSNIIFVDLHYLMKIHARKHWSFEMAEKFASLNKIIVETHCVVIPYCNGGHWTLLLKIGKNMYFVDSYNRMLHQYEGMKKFIKLINDFNKEIYGEEFNLLELKVEQQTDSSSCGYRVLLYCLTLYYNCNIDPHSLSNIKFEQSDFDAICSYMMEYNQLYFEQFGLDEYNETVIYEENDKLQEFIYRYSLLLLDMANNITNSIMN